MQLRDAASSDFVDYTLGRRKPARRTGPPADGPREPSGPRARSCLAFTGPPNGPDRSRTVDLDPNRIQPRRSRSVILRRSSREVPSSSELMSRRSRQLADSCLDWQVALQQSDDALNVVAIFQLLRSLPGSRICCLNLPYLLLS